MRALALMALGAAAATALAGCRAGPAVDRDRPVGARVVSIAVGSGVKLRMARGDRPGVVVRAGRNVIDRVVTETRGDVLHIGVRDRGIVFGHDPLSDVSVRVTLARLRDVLVEGSADVDLAGLHADSLTLRVRGAGDLRARGRVGRLVTDIRGAGDARLGALRARTGRVLVEGAGDVDVDVAQRLDVVVRGAGDVTYRGHPRITRSITGAGAVRATP